MGFLTRQLVFLAGCLFRIALPFLATELDKKSQHRLVLALVSLIDIKLSNKGILQNLLT